MTYSKFHEDWKNGAQGGTAMSEAAWDHVEQGVKDAHDLIAEAATADHTHESADITDATSSNVVDTIVLRDNEGGFAATRITGLSTPTSNTAAANKAYVDAALVGSADSVHTHVIADITNVSAVGAELVVALTDSAARDALDVDSSAEVDTKVSTAQTAAATDATTKATDAELAANTYTDTAVDYAPIHLEYDGTQWPVRPDTSGTNRRCYWWGPSATPVPTTGTAAGGTRAAAPGDSIFEF